MLKGSRENASTKTSTSGKTAPRVAAKTAMRAVDSFDRLDEGRFAKNALPMSAPAMPCVTGSMYQQRLTVMVTGEKVAEHARSRLARCGGAHVRHRLKKV